MSLVHALKIAETIHKDEKKKGSQKPYLYHPLAVASLVLKYGGDSEQAQAALLHDTIDRAKRDELRNGFSDEVVRLAYAFEDPEPPVGAGPLSWREKKEAYLRKVSSQDARALLVIACEEFHEIDELLCDLREKGVEVWGRYEVPNLEVAWYFKTLLGIIYSKLKGREELALVSEYANRVRALNDIVFN